MNKFFYANLFIVLLSLISCNSDNSLDDGSDNNSDVAVTGLTGEIGVTYACINGYVNLSLLPPSNSEPTIGVELYVEGKENNKDYQWSKTSNNITGNQFSVEFSNLAGMEKYKYRTFVKSASLYHYGEFRTFTTKDFKNITSTGEASDITLTSATINSTADVESISSKENIIVGVAYSTNKHMLNSDSVFNQKTCNLTTVKDKLYNITLSGLLTDTKYYYSSFTCAGKSYKLGNIKTFKTKSLDGTLLTNDANDITLTSAILKGTSSISSLYPNGTSITYGFKYATKQTDLENENIAKAKIIDAKIENNNLTAELKSLNSSTTYYYCAYAKVGNVELTGQIKEFKTNSIDEYLTIDEAQNIAFTTAIVKGKTNLASLYKNSTSITYYLKYATTKEYLEKNNSSGIKTVSPTLNGTDLTVSLNNLTEESTYFYLLQAHIDGDYVNSEIKSFKTKLSSDYLFTDDAVNITLNTANINGTTNLSEIFPNSSDIEYYIYYATSENYLTSTSNSNRKSIKAVKDGNKITVSINNLTSKQIYYYRLVACKDNKYMYSKIKNFTTKSESDYIMTGEAKNIKIVTADVTGTTELSKVYPSTSSINYYIYYATSSDELTSAPKNVVANKNSDKLNATLQNLVAATTYYYCIVASIDNKIVYGNINTFKTKDIQTTGYVDLGLSCKWAACNLGASTPESTGNYYAWGEIEPKNYFNSSNYSKIEEKIGTDISATKYDAARKTLGSPHRMPTQAEFEELLNKCRFIEVTYKNTDGYLVIGNNENAIFLPKAGYKDGDKLESDIYYWTSTTHENWGYSSAIVLKREILYGDKYRLTLNALPCSSGVPIRPVQ